MHMDPPPGVRFVDGFSLFMENVTPKRLLVCGPRTMTWDQEEFVRQEIEALQPTEIIHGNAAGADMLGRTVAQKLGIPEQGFDAHWDIHGRSAGFIRNQEMINTKPDQVLAFQPKSGITRGTLDTVRRAIKAGIPVKLVVYDKA